MFLFMGVLTMVPFASAEIEEKRRRGKRRIGKREEKNREEKRRRGKKRDEEERSVRREGE